jgi:signal transduction histidine kinase
VVIRGRPLRLRELLIVLFVLSSAVIATAAVAGGLAYAHLIDERSNALGRIDPADILVNQLLTNYLDEETGVRGYALTGQALFLEPYQSGQTGASIDDGKLGALLSPRSEAGRLLATIRTRAQAWQGQFAIPSVTAIAAGDRAFDGDTELTRGKHLFDSLRQSINDLSGELNSERMAATDRLNSSSIQLLTVMIVSLVVILLDGTLIWMSLRRLVLRPLAAVAADTKVVTGGDLAHEVSPTGPEEVAHLAADIEAMRERIFAEVSSAQDAQTRLATANAELARSNVDLEQFAYVASHDLQEPLRKVASFCELIEQRYGDQLDERGQQYITFAVDGAKRMQVLINDLLSFSRIGRTTDRFTTVDLSDCLDLAKRDLARAIEAAGAEIVTTGRLPVVAGDRTLLIGLFQNLIGNAVKFHGEEPPVVTVSIGHDDEGNWLLGVADNGIGIEPRFAERIFVIFQRLHGRGVYSGTGIGLAMCRKIVEFHGGHIWLDTDYTEGTRFYFTLPPLAKESSGERTTAIAEPAS